MSPPWAGIPLHTGICIAVGKYEELNGNHKLLFQEKKIATAVMHISDCTLKITYLNSVERHIIHVVDHTQQTVRESNESSAK